MKEIDAILRKLKNELPPIFTRKVASQKIGGFYSVGTLRNLDSQGEGPFKIKGKHAVLYERDSFVEWFQGRVTNYNLKNYIDR